MPLDGAGVLFNCNIEAKQLEHVQSRSQSYDPTFQSIITFVIFFFSLCISVLSFNNSSPDDGDLRMRIQNPSFAL